MNTTTSTSSAVGSTVGIVIGIIVYLLYVIAYWRIFTKAGYPGWLAIIPIVNLIFFIKCGNHSGWWVVLYIIPVVNIVVHAFVSVWVSRAYGHGIGFAVGLFFLAFIFVLILGFGNSQHIGGRTGGGALGYA